MYRVTHLRIDGVYRRKSAGTGPVVLKIARITGACLVMKPRPPNTLYCCTSKNSVPGTVCSFRVPRYDSYFMYWMFAPTTVGKNIALPQNFLYYILIIVYMSTVPKGCMCGKREAHINWSMVIPKKAAPVTGTTLRTTGLEWLTLGIESHRYAVAWPSNGTGPMAYGGLLSKVNGHRCRKREESRE